MLTLFTYADIKAVNPEALTPFKAEMLWQLYAATENYLNRSVDDQRLFVEGEDAARLEQIVSAGEGPAESEQFRNFVDGFPKRYLLTHSPAEISSHYRMYKRLSFSPADISVTKRDDYYEIGPCDQGPPVPFRERCGHDFVLGAQYPESGCLRQSSGHRVGYAALFRPFPYTWITIPPKLSASSKLFSRAYPGNST